MRPTIGPQLDLRSALLYVERRPAPSLEPRLLSIFAQACRITGPQITFALEGQQRIVFKHLCSLVKENIHHEVQTHRAPLLFLRHLRSLAMVGLGMAFIVSLAPIGARMHFTPVIPLLSMRDAYENEESTPPERSGTERAPAVCPIKRKHSAGADGETDSPERASKRSKPSPGDTHDEADAGIEPGRGEEGNQVQDSGEDEEDKQDSGENMGEGQTPERASKRSKPSLGDTHDESDAGIEPGRGEEGNQFQDRGEDEEDKQDSGEKMGEGQVKGGKAAKEGGGSENAESTLSEHQPKSTRQVEKISLSIQEAQRSHQT
ncbi:MAG: hypothetical protein OHK93_003336 [Ramalina farinacea]|uniref:Uncharacterized protein n=1 Tax=Ramalina farinacea TaxID=258253 RepID=A0AA43QV30_9LECA|nr:hypothetical protein [Ramalina farinacea]